MTVKAALWARVSDPTKQTTDNQLAPLESEAARRGYEVAKTYTVGESAFQGAHRKALNQVYADAMRGRFKVLIVWSLDRLSREGALATLEIWHRLARAGVTLVSLQEPWVEVAGDFKDVLLALTGWVARFESQRRSERVKAGLARRAAAGKPIGRRRGAKDRHKRKRRAVRIEEDVWTAP